MALPEGYSLNDEVPSVADYCRLRAESGLTPRSPEAAAVGLPNTWAAAIVRAGSGEVVGMGRVIGDGGCFFLLVDMAVLPTHQRRGIGDAILTRLLERLRADAPSEAWVTLFADPPGRKLYARHGFTPTAPQEIGMALHPREQPA